MKHNIYCLFFSLILLIIFVSLHEMTHATIYRMYDCEDITMGISLKGPYTAANCDNEDVRLPQAINEIVGYTIMPLLLLIIHILILQNESNRNA